ncbi:MAG TPA: hypothetical protein VH134_10875 [Candidatus Dormibacteraeota bacterium]|jgi:hypothetical protein|nr:hypothetical protein [Candidatus Dormibacteraeota bacterium]
MEARVMQFCVLVRSIEGSNLPPAQEVALVKETFEQLASGKDKRIKACYPFAGERACCLICECSTPEELQETLALPFSRLVQTECHVITTPRSVVDMLTRVEQQVAGMTAAAGRN